MKTTLSAQELTPIATVKQVDENGTAMNIDQSFEIRGIVHGPNYRPQALQFILIDETGGINVFSQNETLDYVVTEGDELRVIGTVIQFRGLTEIVPESIEILSTGNPLQEPRTVTTLDESTESEFIQLQCLSIIDPTDWGGGGGGFNVDVTDGMNEYSLRVDSAIDLFDQEEAPNGVFHVTGFGWQFDNEEPLLEGYQLYPRSAADVALVSPPANFTYFGGANFLTFIADLSPDISRYDWDFGDGNTASQPNGTTNHAFEEDGFYTVCLTVYSEGDCGEVSSTTCQTVLIGEAPPEFPIYDIAQVTGVNAEGVADSIDTQCELRGIVHSINYSGTGLQFALIDPTDGIIVNRGGGGGGGGNLGYLVTEGDSIHVVGTINQQRGLTRIDVDSIALVSSGHPLNDPRIITQLDESTEADLVKFECMSLENPDQWGAGGGGGFDIDITDGTNSIEVRVDTDTNLFDEDPPIGVFHITGIGWQSAGGGGNADLLASYRLQPRYINDIESVLALDASFDFVIDGNTVSFTAINPTNANNISWDFGDTNTSNGESVQYEYSNIAAYEVCLTLTGESACGETSVTNCQTVDLVPIPVYKIAEIKGMNAQGVADSVGVECELRGIIHTPNYRPQGLQFTIEDETGAIFVFNLDDNLGYEVAVGDMVHVVGTITQFRGLTQMTAEHITVASSGNELDMPRLVNSLSEETESDLVQINCLTLEDPDDWGGGGSFNVDVTNGLESFTMRIDADTELAGSEAPQGTFNAIGVGSQFAPNNADELFGSYQLFPRYLSDLMELVPVSAEFTTGIDEGTINLVAAAPDEDVVSYLWNMGDGTVEVTTEPNFLYTYTAEGDYIITLTVTADDGCGTVSTSTQEVSVVLVGIETINAEKFALQLYPNPANDVLTISSNEVISQVVFHNVLGQVILLSREFPEISGQAGINSPMNSAKRVEVDTQSLQSGVYFVRTLIGGEWAVQRLIVE